jgi:hypothetical protein
MVEMEGPEPVKHRVRQFYRFQKEEVKHLVISILAITFIFAYNDGSESFSMAFWLSNFLIVGVIVAVTFFVHISAQKIFALQQGYMAEYRMWTTGLMLGITIALLSGGLWFLLLPGGIFMQHMAIQRLGKFRYGLNVKSMANIAASGSIANLVLATFAVAMSKQLHILPQFFDKVANINFWFLIFMLLPLPNLPGLYVFFASRLTYVFFFTTLLAYVIMVKFNVYSWILALIIGGICWLLFYMFFEKRARG